jgi:hypothetical protein
MRTRSDVWSWWPSRANEKVFFDLPPRCPLVGNVLPTMAAMVRFPFRYELLSASLQRFSSPFQHAWHECFCRLAERCLCDKKTCPELQGRSWYVGTYHMRTRFLFTWLFSRVLLFWQWRACCCVPSLSSSASQYPRVPLLPLLSVPLLVALSVHFKRHHRRRCWLQSMIQPLTRPRSFWIKTWKNSCAKKQRQTQSLHSKCFPV